MVRPLGDALEDLFALGPVSIRPAPWLHEHASWSFRGRDDFVLFHIEPGKMMPS